MVFHGCMRPVAAGIAIRTPDGISSDRCFVGLARGVFPVNFICYCCVVITKGFVIYLLEDKEELSLRLLDVRIFLISVVILFLELMLIRWIGTEIRVFAYLGNLILVVCFFGTGLGCYLASRPVMLTRLGLNLLFLVALVSNPFHLSQLNMNNFIIMLSGFEDSPIWAEMVGHNTLLGIGGLVIVAVLMYLIVFTFVPAGQILGQAFSEHPRLIRAYSINVTGSLLGICLFNGLSSLSTPPALWFALVALLLVALVATMRPPQWRVVGLAAIAPVVVWLGGPTDARMFWTPYQKLELSPLFVKEGTFQVQQGYSLLVNGTSYQTLINLSDRFLTSHRELFDRRLAERSHYNLPFRFKNRISRMLIVGAGAGNNAAAALRHGVEQIDCVDIDPQILALGLKYHPEHPYDSPRVRMIINDARAFFKQANGPYDAIWFGLLDSHTLGSSYTNLRLDHYVYTLESMREAKRLLANDGIMIVNFYAQRSWIADRLYGQVRQVFGQEPIIYSVEYPSRYGISGEITILGANQSVDFSRIKDPSLRQLVRDGQLRLSGTTRATTDDWPYLYLERPKIPKLHLLISLLLIGTVGLAQRRVFGLRQGLDWHFFFLGAAFLLLEVQTISRATLLFGMTWVVNAIVISAVLVMILAANAVAARWSRLLWWIPAGGLLVTIGALAAVNLNWFQILSGPGKLITASAFLTAPIFFAGLIFVRSFAVCDDKSRALGSNLIGALVGGLLESLSFVTGIRALIVLVALLYALALYLRPRT